MPEENAVIYNTPQVIEGGAIRLNNIRLNSKSGGFVVYDSGKLQRKIQKLEEVSNDSLSIIKEVKLDTGFHCSSEKTINNVMHDISQLL